MKRLIILLLIISPALIIGQGIAINNDNSPPDNTAILDVASDSKGVLLPRLTTQQRTSIASPAPGLTVFDSETFSYWVYLGALNGGWHEVLTTLDKHWGRTGADIYNLNNGNVGIGTSTPNNILSINDINPKIELMHFGTSKAFLQATSSDFKIGTPANNDLGDIVFNTKGADRMWIDENGWVGIGTDSPSSVFTIDGINPWLELKNGGIDKGYVWASGDNLKVGTNAGNTNGDLIFQTKVADRMVIDEEGRVGIGTSSPATTSILTVNDDDPLIQLENNNVSKGFIQLDGDNIRIGTNASNDYGDFVVRTNGADRMKVDENGDIYLNSSSPFMSWQRNGESKGFIGVYENGDDFIIKRTTAGTGKVKITNGISSTKGIHISTNGNTNIGTGLNPPVYKLSVEGQVLATNFTALDVQNWPDYVFADDYEMKSIEEVKQFISDNHHLPNIPDAKEIETNGIELVQMSRNLMEKVEELTLYVIQLNDQNKHLQQQIDELNTRSN